MILPTKEELDAIDMTPVVAQFQNVDETKFLSMEAGKEHYRLLRWISENSNGKQIAELGCYMGLSTMCLAWNMHNDVTCFDIDYSFLKWKKQPGNVKRLLVEGDHDFYKGIIVSDIIFVDTNHFGKMELAVYKFLKQSNWKGILIYDDIYLNDEMKSVWEAIDMPKIDATDIGHIYGTGIIEFK